MIGIGIGNYIGNNNRTRFDPSILPYQALWTCNGKKDTDIDKNIPNLVDPSNPLRLSNFLFGIDSGYETCYQVLSLITQLSARPSFIVEIPNTRSSKLISNFKIIKDSTITQCYPDSYVGVEWKVLLTSDIPDFKLQLDYYDKQDILKASVIIDSNNITTIPAIDMSNLKNDSPRFKILSDIDVNNWFKLEEIPSGNIGLRFDGIDDYFGTVKVLPSLKDYTIIADIAITPLLHGGVGKDLNWYLYGNSVYINGSSALIRTLTTNIIGFNSSGLIVRTNNSLQGLVGQVEATEQQIRSFRSTGWFVFKFLAIVDQVLNENEIRKTYNYLGTLKANNIG